MSIVLTIVRCRPQPIFDSHGGTISLNKQRIRGSIATLFIVAMAIRGFSPVQAEKYGYVQPDCPSIVQQAIDTVSAQCSKMARGQLCYGNSTITAQFQPGTNDIQFQVPGDTVDVGTITQFALGAMDTATNTWGVAEMKIKADLPASDPLRAVTMILFGNVQVSDGTRDANIAAVYGSLPPVRQTQIAVATNTSLNQQATQAASTATKLAGLEASATAHAITPTPTGTIPALRETQAAATATKLAAYEATATAMPLASTSGTDATKGPYAGLQAFYFQSNDSAPCDQAPHDGILIQTPQGTKQRVMLVVDSVTISLGSTVYLTAQPGKFLTINTLEGSAIISAAGQTQTAVAGTVVQVPLDSNLRASGVPAPPQYYVADAVRSLPTNVLSASTVSYMPGLPATISLDDWTAVETVTSGTCTANNSKSLTYPVKLAYDDFNLWLISYYFRLVATKSNPNTYLSTLTFPDRGVSYTDNYSFSLISPDHIVDTINESWTTGVVCTYRIDMTRKSTVPNTP
jgi:hypothetical protein